MAQSVKQNIQDWKDKLNNALHEKNKANDLLATAEEKTGINRLYIVSGLAAFVGIYLMVGYGAQFLCNFIGFLYPAYASVKAIESKQKDDDTKWLTYWVTYAFFSLIEFFADIFLFWIPFYWFFKCLFLAYLMAPTSWNGSIFLYNKVIRPFVLKHEKAVDEALDKAEEYAKEIVDEAKDAGSDAAGEVIRRHVSDSINKED